MRLVDKCAIAIGAAILFGIGFTLSLAIGVALYGALGWLFATGWNAVLVPTIEGIPIIEWWQAAIAVWVTVLISKLLRS